MKLRSILPFAFGALFALPPVVAGDLPVTAEEQAKLTPGAVLAELMAGNKRYVAGELSDPNVKARVKASASGQYPKAVILSCLDSRVPVELVFDRGIGDVFSVRVAGNVLNADVLGSMEYGCKVAGAKLVFVLGHTGCGAVKGACDGIDLGHLGGLLGKIRPAVESVKEPSDPAQRTSDNEAFVNEVAAENVLRVMRQIRTRSVVLAAMLEEGSIGLVGAIYDVASGQLAFLEESLPD